MSGFNLLNKFLSNNAAPNVSRSTATPLSGTRSNEQAAPSQRQLGFSGNYSMPQSSNGRVGYVPFMMPNQPLRQPMSARSGTASHPQRIITKNSASFYQISKPYGTSHNIGEQEDTVSHHIHSGTIPNQVSHESNPGDPNRMSYIYSSRSHHYGGGHSSAYHYNQQVLHAAMYNSCINEKRLNNYPGHTSLASTSLNPNANAFTPTTNFNLVHSKEFVQHELENQRYNNQFNPQIINNVNNLNSSSDRELPRRESTTFQPIHDDQYFDDLVDCYDKSAFDNSPVKGERSAEQLFGKSYEASIKQLWAIQPPAYHHRQQQQSNDFGSVESPKVKPEDDDFDLNAFNKEVHNSLFEEQNIFENSIDETLNQSMKAINFETDSETESEESDDGKLPIVTLPLTPMSDQAIVMSPPPDVPSHQPIFRGRSDSITSIKSNASTRFKEQLYKTEMCRYIVETNTCKYGDACRFAHNENELRKIGQRENYRTEKCHEFSNKGVCTFGWRCWFRHENPLLENFEETMVDLYFNPFLSDYLKKLITPYLGSKSYVPLKY